MNQFEKALQKDILTYLGYLEEYNNYTQKIVQRIVEEHEIEEWQFEDCKPNNEQNFEYKRMRIAIEKATFRQEIFYSINLGELNITQETWENDYFDSDKRAVCEENNNLVYLGE